MTLTAIMYSYFAYNYKNNGKIKILFEFVLLVKYNYHSASDENPF